MPRCAAAAYADTDFYARRAANSMLRYARAAGCVVCIAPLIRL